MNDHGILQAVHLTGVINIDTDVKVYKEDDPMKVVGTLSLRHAVYHYIKMEDGNRLFVELHKAHAMGNFKVVIPTAPQANDMITSRNKNPAAFLLNYLKQEGVNTKFQFIVMCEIIFFSFIKQYCFCYSIIGIKHMFAKIEQNGYIFSQELRFVLW